MRRWFAAAFCLALAGCLKREEGPPGTVLYQEPGGLFTCRPPVSWRVLEGAGEAQKVSFFGPPAGRAPFAASIAVYYHPSAGGRFRTPRDYAAAQAASGLSTPLAERRVGERTVYEFSTRRPSADAHAPPQELLEDTVLIPVEGGLFALVHAAPAAAHDKTAPAFRAVVESFSPAKGDPR